MTPCSAWWWPTSSTAPTPTSPRAADRPAQGGRQRRALAQVADELDLGDASCSARARTPRRSPQAVDPVGRDRGGDRRRLPRRRRAGRPRRRHRLLGHRLADAVEPLAVLDHKTALQELPPGASTLAPVYASARGPRPREALLRHASRSTAAPGATARGVRRSRPSRPPPGRRAHGCRRSTPPPCLSFPRSRPSGRDLDREVAGKTVKAVDDHRRPHRAAGHAEALAERAGGDVQGGQAARKCLLVVLDSGEWLVIHLRMSGQLLKATGRGPRSRSTPTWC